MVRSFARNGSRAFTLVEILMVAAIVGFLGAIIAKLISRSTQSFSQEAWHQGTTNKMETAIQRMNKYLGLASYPTLNTFKGVLRDRSDEYAFQIKKSHISAGDAYSKATKMLARGKEGGGEVTYDSGSAQYFFFGSGVKDDWSEDYSGGNRYTSGSPEQDIITWMSCKPGYKDIPGFAETAPRCGKHRLFLKNRQRVFQASDSTYKFYQDLFLESSFCTTKFMSPVGGSKGYLRGEGDYECSNSDFLESQNTAQLDSEENGSVGVKLLVSSIATVVLKVFQKPNDRSTTVEIDMIAAAPNRGTKIVRKSTQVNISPKVIPEESGFSGNVAAEGGEVEI